jgi:hypothetical protein
VKPLCLLFCISSRRVFLAGIDDGHWGLIKDLHENAKSVIKWEGNISQPFQVNQGGRQWGILSTNVPSTQLFVRHLMTVSTILPTTGNTVIPQ